MFGYDFTESFCEKNSFDGIIRSHEVRERGFSEDHAKCWTVFSASYYCNSNNFGAVIEYSTSDTKFRPYIYKTVEGGDPNETIQSRQIMQKNHVLIKQFKRLIQSKQGKLLKQFRMFDLKRDGTIKTNVWAEIVAKHFNNEISTKHLLYIKDLLCECENILDLVNYKTLFSEAGQSKEIDQNYLGVVKNLFDILDTNRKIFNKYFILV